MHLESLQIEIEVLRKQKDSLGEQQASGLVSETGNLPHKERERQTRLRSKLLPSPVPSNFTASCPEKVCETRCRKEQERQYRDNG